MRKKLIAGAVIATAVLGIGGWFAHRPLVAHWCLAKIETSADESATERLAGLGEYVSPRLVEMLRLEAPACRNAGTVLARMLERWPRDDARAAEVTRLLAEGYAARSPAGRQVSIELADMIVSRGDQPDGARALIRAGLADGDATVRRAALLAAGEARATLADEDLLVGLHDTDADVRELCESTLRQRGLGDKEIRLARLISDPAPLKRLEVIRWLPADTELNAQAWLQRLSRDSSPAVRAAAVRTAQDPESGLRADLSERVREMAQNDPDGTVRQIAEYLMRQAKLPAGDRR